MSNWDVELKNTTIKNDRGMPFVTMMVPEGWGIVYSEKRDAYCGHIYPYFIFLKLMSPDNTCAIRYTSPRQIIQDHLEPQPDCSIDAYGNLHGTVMSMEGLLKERADEYLNHPEIGITEYSFIKQMDFTSNEEEAAKRLAEKKKAIESNPMKVITDYYYKGGVQIYRFKRNDHIWRFAPAAISEATTYKTWDRISPTTAMMLNDPLMKNMASMWFSNLEYNKALNAWVYLESFETDWRIFGVFELECREEDYVEIAKKIYFPILNKGVSFTDEQWSDWKRVRNKLEEGWKAEREAKKQTQKKAEIQREQKKESDPPSWQKVRDTQKEIHDMQRDSYEYRNKLQRKTREIWSDAIRGDTRFVDRHGDEHVIHTYNNYAYKNGDSYVTSDSKLFDAGSDWEELEKKKY